MRLSQLLTIFPLLFLLVITGSAQDRKCAANEVMERQIARDPGFAGRMIAIEKHTQEFIASKKGGSNNKKPPGTPGGGGSGGGNPPPTFSPVTIPVVVHIIYNANSPAQNIDRERVNEQIDILNKDFAGSNWEIDNTNTSDNKYIPSQYTDVVAHGSGISFSLADIISVETSVTSFSTNDAMKFTSSGGSDAVDPAHFLNIWVCNMGGGILGYAQFPGGNPATDGVVILYSAFGNTSGNYGLGRTATHEVGHYFNLRHIWGDRRCGDDFVNDTPLHDGANYGCPGQGATSNCKGPVVEMWMNYMDYTYDQCMYMFSEGQALRMQATLTDGGPHYSLVQPRLSGSSGTITNRSLMPSSEVSARETKAFQLYPNLTNGEVYVSLNASQRGMVDLSVFNEAGVLVSRKRLSVAEGDNTQTLSFSNLSNGIYFARLTEGTNTYIRKLVIQH